MDFKDIFEYEYECYGCEHCYFKHGFVRCDLNKNEDEDEIYVQGEVFKERRNHYCIKRNV
jgi:hypothetical protein